ncbi:MAG: hypothetical protein GTO63_30860 [Anaerolineae bacterium]|nr:hypothetical protein [Anaerolineae bacterium]NIN99096.1 hypothetical protein [Anaerolineae bacterium]NIQ81940.1 hypothetical protein [Anaerolineae bacterium]
MERRLLHLATSVWEMALRAVLGTARPTYSSPSAPANPKLTVESCLVQGTTTFRLRETSGAVTGEWRLKLLHGEEVIDSGYLEGARIHH